MHHRNSGIHSGCILWVPFIWYDGCSSLDVSSKVVFQQCLFKRKRTGKVEYPRISDYRSIVPCLVRFYFYIKIFNNTRKHIFIYFLPSVYVKYFKYILCKNINLRTTSASASARIQKIKPHQNHRETFFSLVQPSSISILFDSIHSNIKAFR